MAYSYAWYSTNTTKTGWNLLSRSSDTGEASTVRVPRTSKQITCSSCSSDVTGAIDYAAMPYLNLERSKSPSIWSAFPKQKLQTIRKDVDQLLSPCGMRPDLVSVMTELAYFSLALRSMKSNSSLTLDLTAYSEDMYSIESKLLAFPSSSFGPSAESNVEKSCRLGSLIYIKAILEEFPHSKTGSSNLLKMLQESLHSIPKNETMAALLLWLSTIGASLSPTADRGYFICLLAELASTSEIISFDDEEMGMSKVLPLRDVFGSSLETLWGNVTAVKKSYSTP